MSLWRNIKHKVWVDRGFDFEVTVHTDKNKPKPDKKK